MKTLKSISKLSTLLMLALALTGMLALTACEGAEEPDDGDDVATVGVPEEETVSDVDAMMAIDDVSIGSELSEDGAIQFGTNTDDFAPGQTVYVAMEVGDAMADSEVRVVWYGPDGNEIESQTKTVMLDQHYMNFASPDTSGWAFGEYKGEVWYGSELVNEFEINITEDEAEDMAEGEES